MDGRDEELDRANGSFPLTDRMMLGLSQSADRDTTACPLAPETTHRQWSCSSPSVTFSSEGTVGRAAAPDRASPGAISSAPGRPAVGGPVFGPAIVPTRTKQTSSADATNSSGSQTCTQLIGGHRIEPLSPRHTYPGHWHATYELAQKGEMLRQCHRIQPADDTWIAKELQQSHVRRQPLGGHGFDTAAGVGHNDRSEQQTICRNPLRRVGNSSVSCRARVLWPVGSEVRRPCPETALAGTP